MPYVAGTSLSVADLALWRAVGWMVKTKIRERVVVVHQVSQLEALLASEVR